MEFWTHVAYGFGAGVGLALAITAVRSASDFLRGLTEGGQEKEEEE